MRRSNLEVVCREKAKHPGRGNSQARLRKQLRPILGHDYNDYTD
jgi:hypothetical protein